MNRTRKWDFVQQEAKRLAAMGLSPKEIAARLEVNRNTVTRWMQQGKLVRGMPVQAPLRMGGVASPEQWAKVVRETYNLDATDSELVTLAAKALAMAQDTTAGASVQLQAMGRFQAMVKQLALVARLADQETEPDKPRRPGRARPAVDPRSILKAV